jgi:hypothetical protein
MTRATRATQLFMKNKIGRMAWENYLEHRFSLVKPIGRRRCQCPMCQRVDRKLDSDAT